MNPLKCFAARTTLSVAILVASAPLYAQGTPRADDTSPGRVLEETVVTAQRRSESLQESSLSIVALTAEEMAENSVTQVRDLAALVPGVQIGQAGAATQIYIRGIGDFGSTSQTNPAVAFNVDGVYVARPAGVEGNFYDMERVEILKGPQGTLYGRNATGGAINVITQKPNFDSLGGYGSLDIGNYDKIAFQGAVNVPINEQLAVRAALNIVDRDPYVNYNFGDDKQESGRLHVLWRPSDRLSLLMSGDYTHVGGGGAEYVPLNSIDGVGDEWTSITDPRVADFYDELAVASGLCAPIPLSPYSGACPQSPVPFYQLVEPFNGDRGDTDNEFWSVSAQLDYEFDFATLTVLPAYRSAELDYNTYPGGFLFDLSAEDEPETSEATSFEVRLANETEDLKWVGGLYYFDEKQRGLAIVDAGFVQYILIEQSLDTTSYAAFGQATYSFTDNLRLIGGARYTSDDKTVTPESYHLQGSAGFLTAVGAGCTPGPVGGTPLIGCQLPSVMGDDTFDEFNWKAGVEYDLADDNMLYLIASTGFKAGGFYNGEDASGGAGSYDPETVLAYQLGSRNRFLDQTLQLNLEAFYYDYKDHQEPVIIRDVRGTTVQSQQNAGDGTIYGIDVDLVYLPTENGSVHVAFEYLDTEYDEFVYSSPIVPGLPLFIPPGASGCDVTDTASEQIVDCSGFPLTRSPEWSGSVAYSHNFDLANGGNIEAEANMHFASSQYLSTDYLSISRISSYETYNALLTYRAPEDDWSLTAYVKNITDEAVYTGAIRSSFVVGFSSASLAAPRTYGVRLSMNF